MRLLFRRISAPNPRAHPSSSRSIYYLGENTMHIALYGATGKPGSRILTELLSRGHAVSAVVRDPAKLAPQPLLTIVQGDVSSVDAISEKIKGVDAVVSAYGPPPDDTDQVIFATENLIA